MSKPFIFRCPTTALSVQGISETDEAPVAGKPRYQSVVCLACKQVHIVDPETGRLFSDEQGRDE